MKMIITRNSKTRKLYNVTDKRATNLSEIRKLVAAGFTISAKDEKNTDITADLLRSALHDAEKNRKMSVDWLLQQIKDYEKISP